MGPVTTQQTFFPRPPTAHDVGVRNPVTWLSTTLGAKDAGPPQWCAQAPPWPHCGPAPAALVAPAQVKAGGKGSLLVSEALWASVGASGLWCLPPPAPAPAIQGSEAAGGPGLGGAWQHHSPPTPRRAPLAAAHQAVIAGDPAVRGAAARVPRRGLGARVLHQPAAALRGQPQVPAAR